MEQQEIMVKIMKEEWDGLLIDKPLDTCDPEQRLPRLDEMLNKILIKVKRADPEKLEPTLSHNSLVPVSSRDSGTSGSEAESSKKKTKICANLGNLGIYTNSQHFVSFEEKSAKKPSHIFSIGEKDIMELHEKKPSDMFTHNRDYFMRSYPAGFRIDSSNFDPSALWRKGVQMVALNWQSIDEAVMLNEGMFAGEDGWVLKPPGYRTDPTEPVQYKTLYLKITVFAGQDIPLPPHQTLKGFHPYIRCELHVGKQEEYTGEPIEEGGKANGAEPKYKHKTSGGQGDHLDFGREGYVLDFPCIGKVVEELSFVRLVAFLFVSVMYHQLVGFFPPHAAVAEACVSHHPSVTRTTGALACATVRSACSTIGSHLVFSPARRPI